MNSTLMETQLAPASRSMDICWIRDLDPVHGWIHLCCLSRRGWMNHTF